jgi:hypothetical protein
MPETPTRGVRVAPELEAAARRAAPELTGLDFGTLARVALAVLAGLSVREALKSAQTRPGPKPKAGAVT